MSLLNLILANYLLRQICKTWRVPQSIKAWFPTKCVRESHAWWYRTDSSDRCLLSFLRRGFRTTSSFIILLLWNLWKEKNIKSLICVSQLNVTSAPVRERDAEAESVLLLHPGSLRRLIPPPPTPLACLRWAHTTTAGGTRSNVRKGER